MRGHLGALNAAEDSVPGANAAWQVIVRAMEAEDQSSDDNGRLFPNPLIEENWDGMGFLIMHIKRLLEME